MKINIFDLKQKYKKEKVRMFRNIFFTIVVLIYICFFTSNLWIPQELTDREDVTVAGKEISYCMAERTCKVISATYDKEKEEFEILMQLGNRSYDGINDYYYAFDLTGAGKKHTVIKEVLNDSLVTVVRVYNIKIFREMTFYVAPKLSEDIGDITDEETAFLIFNKYNLSYGSIDNNKSATGYLRDRLEGLYTEYLKKEERYQAKIEKLQAELEAVKADSIELSESMEYMTYEEQIYAEKHISDNEKKEAEIAENIEKEKAKLEKVQASIKRIKQQIAEL